MDKKIYIRIITRVGTSAAVLLKKHMADALQLKNSDIIALFFEESKIYFPMKVKNINKHALGFYMPFKFMEMIGVADNYIVGQQIYILFEYCDKKKIYDATIYKTRELAEQQLRV